MSRFDYIKYDEESQKTQQELKEKFEKIEKIVDDCIQDGRAKSLVMTHLEIAYMWTGKAIRDAQVLRECKSEDKPERG